MKFSVCIFDFTKSYTTIIASFWHHLINGWISQAFGSNFRHWSVQDRSRNGWPLILTKLWLLNQFFKTWKQWSVFRKCGNSFGACCLSPSIILIDYRAKYFSEKFKLNPFLILYICVLIQMFSFGQWAVS